MLPNNPSASLLVTPQKVRSALFQLLHMHKNRFGLILFTIQLLNAPQMISNLAK